jgi:hypothetical protein
LPDGVQCRATLGILLVAILITCPSHLIRLCFISPTMYWHLLFSSRSLLLILLGLYYNHSKSITYFMTCLNQTLICMTCLNQTLTLIACLNQTLTFMTCLNQTFTTVLG